MELSMKGIILKVKGKESCKFEWADNQYTRESRKTIMKHGKGCSINKISYLLKFISMAKLCFISGNNMSFLKQYNNGDDKHSIINGMIENGHMNDNDQYNGLFDSIPEKVKKRDLKAIQVESNNNQWSKTGDIKSILENSPPKLRRNSKSWDKNSFFDSQDHSVDIEYDHIKLEKPLDTISLVNHNILGDTINKEIDTIHPLPIIPDNENNNFEILSKNQEEDLPLDSISSFSSEQKLWGIKRTHEFEYQK